MLTSIYVDINVAVCDDDRVAELGSLSSGAKIFASNASVLRVIANLQS